eukprot:2768312-Amphidinium_carterae.1
MPHLCELVASYSCKYTLLQSLPTFAESIVQFLNITLAQEPELMQYLGPCYGVRFASTEMQNPGSNASSENSQGHTIFCNGNKERNHCSLGKTCKT